MRTALSRRTHKIRKLPTPTRETSHISIAILLKVLTSVPVWQWFNILLYFLLPELLD